MKTDAMDKKVTDLHMHIIPDVDDGAGSIEESLAMLRLAESEGIGKIIATPHSGAFDGMFNPVRKRFELLKAKAKEAGIDVDLRLGCEVYVDGEEIKRVLKCLKKGKYPTMDGSDYVLVEFDLCSENFEEAVDCVNMLTAAGYTPIVAHAERYRYSVDQIYEMCELGCLIQVNYSNVLPGQFGSAAHDKAIQMLKDKRVSFLSTDSHGIKRRKPAISEAVCFLYDNFDKDYIDKVLFDHVFAKGG